MPTLNGKPASLLGGVLGHRLLHVQSGSRLRVPSIPRWHRHRPAFHSWHLNPVKCSPLHLAWLIGVIPSCCRHRCVGFRTLVGSHITGLRALQGGGPSRTGATRDGGICQMMPERAFWQANRLLCAANAAVRVRLAGRRAPAAAWLCHVINLMFPGAPKMVLVFRRDWSYMASPTGRARNQSS